MLTIWNMDGLFSGKIGEMTVIAKQCHDHKHVKEFITGQKFIIDDFKKKSDLYTFIPESIIDNKAVLCAYVIKNESIYFESTLKYYHDVNSQRKFFPFLEAKTDTSSEGVKYAIKINKKK